MYVYYNVMYPSSVFCSYDSAYKKLGIYMEHLMYIHLIGSISLSLSSPPVAGVWWAHWCRCPVAAVASSKWMLHTGGGWGETPHMIVKRFGCTTIHKKRYINASFIHSFIHLSLLHFLTIIITLNKIANFNMSVAKTVNQVLHLFQVAFMAIKASLSNVFPQLIHFKSIIF